MNIFSKLTRLFLIFPLALSAQEFDFKRVIDPFPIQGIDGEIPEYPFLGGFDAPRPQFVDIDADGDPDLFVQEQSRTDMKPGQLIFFENTGTAANFNFEWRTDQYKNIDVGNWYKFIDMDADGDPDLFTESEFSRIRYYRNNGSPASAQFTVLTDTLRDENGEQIFFDLGSLPDFSDIDCDGDFDLFIGRISGSITFYRNIGLTAQGIPRFEFVTDQFENISIEEDGGVQITATNSSHGANALTFADINNDAVPDLFWGDLNEAGIIFLANTGGCPNPEINITTRSFPESDPLNTSGFNVPRFADIDNDDDPDMFVAVLGGIFSNTRHLIGNFIFYENTGPVNAPIFQRKRSQFIASFDIGANSIPVFADIDNDGDLDLFMGNESIPETGSRSQLIFFENIGSENAPNFQLADADYLNLNLGFNYAPTFVDIDADDDLDLFIGEWDGRLNLLKNIGTPESPVFDAPQPFYAGIDVRNNNTPTFVDIDADGDLDLFMGSARGDIYFYKNNGDATAPDFVLETATYFDIGVDVKLGDADTLHSYPTFTDIDSDNDTDLMVGFENGQVFLYRNNGSAANAAFSLETVFDLEIKGRAAPHLLDIDSDGDLDLISGESKGGLVFYQNQIIGTLPSSIPEAFALRQNYPNPFNPQTKIEYDLRTETQVTLTIFNVAGQSIKTLVDDFKNAGTYHVQWDGRDDAGQYVASGIYFYRLKTEGFTKVRRMLLIR